MIEFGIHVKKFSHSSVKLEPGIPTILSISKDRKYLIIDDRLKSSLREYKIAVSDLQGMIFGGFSSTFQKY